MFILSLSLSKLASLLLLVSLLVSRLSWNLSNVLYLDLADFLPNPKPNVKNSRNMKL